MEQNFGIEEIKKLIPHRYPFLLIDRVLKIEENFIQGIKNVTINEPFFQGHFPNEPIMPGVLQTEAMAQLAAIFAIKMNQFSNPSVYFLSIDKAKFRHPVIPGDQLVVEIQIKHNSHTRMSFRGEAKVDGKVVSEAEMLAMVRENKE